MKPFIATLAVLLSVPIPALAHHSHAEFSEIDHRLEGQLLEVQWRNPHPRFTLSDDQSRFDFHMAVTDPATFTEPTTFDKYWLALGGELQHYECVAD